ncbi:MAG: AI-2E family transporter [Crocinitomicaceae bacterium]
MISNRLFKTIIVVSICVLLIYYAQGLIMPILFSALCAILVHPLVKRFERIGLNLVLSSLFVVMLLGGAFALTISWFSYEGYEILTSLPTNGVEEMTENPLTSIEKQTTLEVKNYSSEIYSMLDSSKQKLMGLIPSTIKGVNKTLVFLLSCPVYIFFMLICRSSIRKFYYTSFKPQRRAIANRILNQIELVYAKYVRGLFLVALIVGTLSALGLYLLGIRYAFVLGALSGILTLVPYLGVIISALIPVVIALLTKDSFWYAGGVIGVYALIQFIEGNIITPKIMGDQVGINPLMVILGIVIFGTIGGILGMLMTIPFLALIKIISFYIPNWKPLRSLISVS